MADQEEHKVWTGSEQCLITCKEQGALPTSKDTLSLLVVSSWAPSLLQNWCVLSWDPQGPYQQNPSVEHMLPCLHWRCSGSDLEVPDIPTSVTLDRPVLEGWWRWGCQNDCTPTHHLPPGLVSRLEMKTMLQTGMHIVLSSFLSLSYTYRNTSWKLVLPPLVGKNKNLVRSSRQMKPTCTSQLAQCCVVYVQCCSTALSVEQGKAALKFWMRQEESLHIKLIIPCNDKNIWGW